MQMMSQRKRLTTSRYRSTVAMMYSSAVRSICSARKVTFGVEVWKCELRCQAIVVATL